MSNAIAFPRRLALFAAALLIGVLVVACGGNSANDQLVPIGTPGKSPVAAGSTPAAGGTSTASNATCGPAGSRIAAIPRAGTRKFAAAPERVIDPAKSYIARLETSRGSITLELDAANTPLTVNNFVFLACDGFYDGLTFHRVVAGFVAQGGDPAGNGSGDPGYKFATEINPKIKHDAAGVVSMANSGPNSNGSQFFITLAPAPHLDTGSVGFFNAFGRVTAGQNVVNSIAVGDKIISVSIDER